MDQLKIIWLVQEEMKKRQKEMEKEIKEKYEKDRLRQESERKPDSSKGESLSIEEVKQLIDREIAKIKIPDVATIMQEAKSSEISPATSVPNFDAVIDQKIETALSSSLRNI